MLLKSPLTHPLALSARSLVLCPVLALLPGWPGGLDLSPAAMLAGSLQPGVQVVLPAQAGSSPLAFCLREHRLGQRQGGAGRGARFLGWQSRLSSFSCAVRGEVTVPAVPPAPCLSGTRLVPQHVPATCRGWTRSPSRGEGRLRLGRRHCGKFGFGTLVSMGWGRRAGLPKSFCRSRNAWCSQGVAGLSQLSPKQWLRSPHRAGLGFFLLNGTETRQHGALLGKT